MEFQSMLPGSLPRLTLIREPFANSGDFLTRLATLPDSCSNFVS